MTTGCAVCRSAAAPRLVETHRDAIGGKDYRVLACPDCGGVYSEPRVAVGGDWYAAFAPIRLEEFARAPARDPRFMRFLSEGLAPGRLLDIGCGDGGFLELARARGWSALGFDYDARVVAAARARGLEAEAAEFSAFCRGLSAGSFDAVTLFDVLEHTPEPIAMMEEVRRLLKPGAHAVITFPNALRPLPWGRELHDYPPHHFTRWTPAATRAFLERLGFSVARQEHGRLSVYYLAEHLFFLGLMPRLLPLARRLLFGRRSEGKTISELYREDGQGGALADKRARHRLVSALKLGLRPLTYPAALGMLAYYRATRGRECGEHLYTLARKR